MRGSRPARVAYGVADRTSAMRQTLSETNKHDELWFGGPSSQLSLLAKHRVIVSWSPKLLELSRTQAQFHLSEERSRKDGCPLSEVAFSKIEDQGEESNIPSTYCLGDFSITSLVIATLGGNIATLSGDREKCTECITCQTLRKPVSLA